MAGHSHWAGIKHKKGKADKERANLFSKLSREITVAAKLGDKNPEMNPRLRTAIQAAKQANMPKENILRAIKRPIIDPLIYPIKLEYNKKYNSILSNEDIGKINFNELISYNLKWYLADITLYLPRINDINDENYSLYFYKNKVFVFSTKKEKLL